MYKLMIIDDEPLIRTGLKNLIEWEIYGIEVVEEADDGMKAYFALKNGHIDIALVDINMPGMNGIELIELCTHLKNKPQFIILSGYSDFEYVRAAMKYGCSNYLLKPVDQEELVNTVISTVKTLDEVKNTAQQLQESSQVLKNDMLLRLVTNRIELRELREKGPFANITFHSSSLRIGLLKPTMHNANKILPKGLSASIISTCENFCKDTCECYVAIDATDNIIIIFKEYTQTIKSSDYQYLLGSLVKNLVKILPYSLQIALSEKVSTVQELPAAYLRCSQSIEHTEITHSLFQKDSLLQLEKSIPYDFSYSNFTSCLEEQNNERLTELFHYYFAEMLRQDSDNSLDYIKYQLVEFIICVMQELKPSLLSEEDLTIHKKEAFHIIKSSTSLKELETQLLYLFVKLMERLNDDSRPSYSPPVQTVHRYVRNHYQDINLSLKTLAAQLNLNAAYLGRQFAAETNEYFSDYLNRVRIAKAVHFLKKTSWKTSKIAEEVGFANITYFFTVFKKITGKKPGDYRKGITE